MEHIIDEDKESNFMDKKIIVINAGSSSIKFQIYKLKNYEVLASGLCERIFLDGHFKMKYSKSVY